MGCETHLDGICVPSQASFPLTLICSFFEFVNLFMKIYVILPLEPLLDRLLSVPHIAM